MKNYGYPFFMNICGYPLRSTNDVVRTSGLSTRWTSLWQWVSGLDLDSSAFSNFNAFVSFIDRFLYSHKGSRINKVRLNMDEEDYDGRSFVTPWMDVVTTRRIQHLDVKFHNRDYEIPLCIYTCETLVHLRLCWATFPNVEFVSLPCLKTMHLEEGSFYYDVTMEILISCSPVLEDLRIIRCSSYKANVLQVCSQTLKRIHIDRYTQVVIDAPLLQCLKTKIYEKNNFKIVKSNFPAKLDIDYGFPHVPGSLIRESVIRDIITDISKIRDLVISGDMWKVIVLHSTLRPLLQFRFLSRLNVICYKTNLEVLPTLLESCPKLGSLILELVKDPFMPYKMEPDVLFSAVPRCLVSSLRFVELKRSIKVYENEMKLIRYFLKNSTILEQLKLDIYITKRTECDFFKELVAIPRCSSACEVIVL